MDLLDEEVVDGGPSSDQQTTPTTTTSDKNRKDLERFVKFFIIKSIQVIVQSRINGNKKIKTECRPPKPNNNNNFYYDSDSQQQQQQADWFNLRILDDDSILQSTRGILNPTGSHQKVQITIYLESSSTNDRLVLEIWSLVIRTNEDQSAGGTEQQSQPTTRVIYNVYNRMSLLLKSLISVSRVTPAYKIARRSTTTTTAPDEFKIGWAISEEEPNLEEDTLAKLLGERFKRSLIGKVTLPTDSPQHHHHHHQHNQSQGESKANHHEIGISLYYRTKMELNLSSMVSNRMFIKSDHYGYNNDEQNSKETTAHEKKVKEFVKPAFSLQQTTDNNSELNNDGIEYKEVSFDELDHIRTHLQETEQTHFVRNIPFGFLLLNKSQVNLKATNLTTAQDQTQSNQASKVTEPSPTEPPPPPHTHKVPQPSPLLPFAGSSSSSSTDNNDLLNIFEEFRVAPDTLGSFNELRMDGSLENFENDIIFYDDFVNKLCHEN